LKGCATYFGTIWKRSLTRVFKNIIFFMFLNRFDVLISKIIKNKTKKIILMHFYAFLSEKHFEPQPQPQF
jgi:hypothetical protein